MSAKELAFEVLRERLAEAERWGKASPAKLKKDWITALKSLFALMRGWMREAEEQGLLRVSSFEVEREEELLGKYKAPALKIVAADGAVVTVAPRALDVAGSRGRVDMERPPRKEIIIRQENESWSIAEMATRGAGWTFTALDEETFWEYLRRLFD